MQLFTAIFVKNKCIFLTILLQQQLALVIRVFSSLWTGAGLRPKKCGASTGWDSRRVRSVRVRAKFLKLLQVQTQNFNPHTAQDSTKYPKPHS